MEYSGTKDKGNKPIEDSQDGLVVFSPTNGRVVPLNQVEDEVFRKEMVGKGIGIFPEIPLIFSPVNGIIKYIPETKHAIIVVSDDGIEVLVHIGIDTVELKGQFFDLMVEVNSKVKVGDPLLRFDKKAISARGFNLVIPVIITNANDFSQVVPIDKERVVVEERLIEVFK